MNPSSTLSALLILTATLFPSLAIAQNPDPAPLTVASEPCVELLSIIFRLAGNPEYQRGRIAAYTKAADAHFGTYAGHEVVQLARRLRQERGISYDAVMSMAMHLRLGDTLEARTPFDPRPTGLESRWRVEDAQAFLEAARRFVEDTGFRKFIDDHATLYETARSRLQETIDRHVRIYWFDSFFGRRPSATFVAVPAPLNGPNNYGGRRVCPDGAEDLYCVLGVWKTDWFGQPSFDSGMMSTVIHEFCHSYANPVIDHHLGAFRPAGERIFPHVAGKMKRMAYPHWAIMLRESLVRACVIRYTRRHTGRAAAWLATKSEQSLGFAWMPELVDHLDEYEADRSRYPSLDAFSTRLVEFFDGVAKEYPGSSP